MSIFSTRLACLSLSALLLLGSACQQQKSATSSKALVPKGWVSDYEGLLTPAQVHFLDSVINQFEKETSVEIALVTLSSKMVVDGNLDSTVTALGEAWGVGKKDKNNGVIIGISASLRKMRISTGRGIERRLTDQRAKAIIVEEMTPRFAKGKYYEGCRQGLDAIMKEVR